MTEPTLTRPGSPECEVLFELFSAPRGRVLLGRLNSGRETGRVVRLRAIDAAALPLASEAVAATRDHEFSCPELLKLLDVAEDGTQSYVASEYLPGISLFELTARARRQGGMHVGAAVNIALSAMRRLEQAASLLAAAGRPRPRLFYADCIWIADYGETLLAEPGVSAYLGGNTTPDSQEVGADAELHDARAIAVELYQLVSGKLLFGDLARALADLPAPLARVLTGLLVFDEIEGYDAASAFAEGLAALPPSLRATDPLVAGEIRRLAGDVLDERERKLSEYRTGAGAGTDGPTRVYSGGTADYDSDELTVQVQSFRRGVPVPLISRAELLLPFTAARKQPAAEKPQLAETRPAARRRLAVAPPRSLRRLPWIAAGVLLVAALILTMRLRPAWFDRLVPRVHSSH